MAPTHRTGSEGSSPAAPRQSPTASRSPGASDSTPALTRSPTIPRIQADASRSNGFPSGSPATASPTGPVGAIAAATLGRASDISATPFRATPTGRTAGAAFPAAALAPAPVSTADFADLLDCPVCMDSLVEPITIACGHTFCRPCLVEALSRSTKQCPSCRHATHIDPVTAPESTVIKSVLVKLNPVGYADRVAAVAAARLTWSERHPIFFYNDVAFPSTPIQLVFFEPRYKLMMQRVIDGSAMFIWLPCTARSYAAAIGDVAVVCRLQEAHNLPDGRYAVKAVAERRVAISDTWEEPGAAGLWYGQVEALKDTPPTSDEMSSLVADISRTYRHLKQYVSRIPRPSLLGVPDLPTLPANPTIDQAEAATWRMVTAVFALVQLGPSRLGLGSALLRMRTTRLRWEWVEGCVEQLRVLVDDDGPASPTEEGGARGDGESGRAGERGDQPGGENDSNGGGTPA